MAIDFICPTCNGTLRVGDESAGRVIRCGACRTMLRVPGAPQPAPAAAVPVAPPRAKPSAPPEPTPDAGVDLVNEPMDAELLPLAAEEAPADQPTDPEAVAVAALNADEPRAAEPAAPTTSSDAPQEAEPASPAPTGRRSWDPDWNNPADRPDRDRDDDRPRRDRDGQPRRRRRAPPPPPRGRGVLFWLVVTGGVFALLTVGCCGGLYVVIPGPKWQKHESARGGFKVDLPAPAETEMGKRAGGGKPGAEMHTEGTMLFGRMEEFAIVYGDIPPFEQQFGTDKQRMDDAVKGMKESGEVGSVLSQKDMTVGGFPAREVEFSAKGGGWYVSRIIIADGRVYVLVAGGRFAKPGNENARRFLDSFEITDPKLKTVGQKKADDERRQADERERVRAAQAKREDDERIARAKREEDERIAREVARRLAEYKQEIREGNAAFQAVPFTGPAPGHAPGVSPADEDAFQYSFERDGFDGGISALANGAWPKQHDPAMRPAVHGPGVRGKGVYLTRDTKPAAFTDHGMSTPGQLDLARNTDGFTVAGWVRVRTAPITVISLREGGRGQTPGEITVGRTHITARVTGPDGKPVDVQAAWTRDEKWHHVALVRATKQGAAGARLYLDGKLVASADVGAPAPPQTFVLSLGWLRDSDPEWPGPAGVDGNPAPPTAEHIIGAIDECALIGRPITDAEVLVLYGSAQPAPIEVKLAPGRKLAPVGTVAFDPLRKVVWVADGPDPTAKPNAPRAPAMLRKLSYPELEEIEAYELPGPATAGALDVPRNRLFLAVSTVTDLPGTAREWPRGIGTVQRYDLDALPGTGRRLAPGAELAQFHSVGAVAVAPDGATVYFSAAPAARAVVDTIPPQRPEYFLHRTTAALTAPEQMFKGRVYCPERLEASPDGLLVMVAGGPEGALVSLVRVQPGAGAAIEPPRKTNPWERPPEPGGAGLHVLFSIRTVPGDWVPVNERRALAVTGGSGAHMWNKAEASWHRTNTPVGNGYSYPGGLANGRLVVTSGRDTAPGAVNAVRVYAGYVGSDNDRKWSLLAERTETADVPVGGPFWTAPDGKVLVFRSGQIVRVEARIDLSPNSEAVKRLVLAPPGAGSPVAPRPRVRPTEVPVPSATDFAGLKLYLTFDELAAGRVHDAVKNEAAGTVASAVLVDGPRGKAVRVVSPRSRGRVLGTAPVAGIRLDPERLRVPANKPFALAFWVRASEVEPRWAPMILRATNEVPTGTSTRSLSLTISVTSTFSLRDPTGRVSSSSKVVRSEWNHFALVRDDENRIRVLVNGRPVTDDKPATFGGALDYTATGLVVDAYDWAFVDLDEFCLFDRELSDDEIARLAGRKVLPVAPTPRPVE